jgi:hypothetical protein
MSLSSPLPRVFGKLRAIAPDRAGVITGLVTLALMAVELVVLRRDCDVVRAFWRGEDGEGIGEGTEGITLLVWWFMIAWVVVFAWVLFYVLSGIHVGWRRFDKKRDLGQRLVLLCGKKNPHWC